MIVFLGLLADQEATVNAEEVATTQVPTSEAKIVGSKRSKKLKAAQEQGNSQSITAVKKGLGAVSIQQSDKQTQSIKVSGSSAKKAALAAKQKQKQSQSLVIEDRRRR